MKNTERDPLMQYVEMLKYHASVLRATATVMAVLENDYIAQHLSMCADQMTAMLNKMTAIINPQINE